MKGRRRAVAKARGRIGGGGVDCWDLGLCGGDVWHATMRRPNRAVFDNEVCCRVECGSTSTVGLCRSMRSFVVPATATVNEGFEDESVECRQGQDPFVSASVRRGVCADLRRWSSEIRMASARRRLVSFRFEPSVLCDSWTK